MNRCVLLRMAASLFMRIRAVLVAALLPVLLCGCVDSVTPGGIDPPAFDTKLSALKIDREYFRDEYGRYVLLNGVNVGGTNKLPVTPAPDEDPRKEPISFVGRPFPLDEADLWFDRIAKYGFNSIRLVIPWEAVEHGGRGIYDKEYLFYIEAIVAKAQEHDIYVLMNFHENLFSRFLYTRFNRNPELGEEGSIENMLGALLPDSKTLKYGGVITGDGAPRWAVEACLPHKNIDAPNWGSSHFLGNLGILSNLIAVVNAVDKLTGLTGGEEDEGGDGSGETGPSLEDFLQDLLKKMMKSDPPMLPYEITETCDVFPFTSWWDNTLFSYDINRCYGAFFAGDAVMPSLNKFESGGKTWEMDIKEYLQGGYAGAWAQVAKRAGKYPNVIGYDLINEPPGGFLMLAILTLYFQADFDLGVIEDFLVSLAGTETGQIVYQLLQVLNVLPLMPSKADMPQYMARYGTEFKAWLAEDPDVCADEADDAAKTECQQVAFVKQRIRKSYGADDIDLFGVLDLNLSFVVNLVELYDVVSQAIRGEDPDAVIWLEPGSGALDALVGGTFGDVSLWKPESIDEMVYTPHWYPDIYPFLGFNAGPREFTVEEWADVEFLTDLAGPLPAVLETFGEVPVVYGEFGTYFNYNGIENSVASNYAVSAEILNNYYEAFETLNLGRMLWCFSKDNTHENGDLWNYEDFSIIGPDHEPRAELAWMRPYGRALSGRPVATYFNSDYHHYDPKKGEPDPWREFYLSFESKETDAPTEVFVPDCQYPDGFYVWLSDGWATFDSVNRILYYHPTRDDPGHVHEVTLRPPMEGAQRTGWAYFFRDGQVVVGDRH
ncbi:MAG: hypothetical protein FJ109_07645 [Deltaproteobacteria bacterium]|nr:hypothetical protein [Deltaproteobacteria bacterium]